MKNDVKGKMMRKQTDQPCTKVTSRAQEEVAAARASVCSDNGMKHKGRAAVINERERHTGHQLP